MDARVKLRNSLELLGEVKVEKWRTISISMSLSLFLFPRISVAMKLFSNGGHLESHPIFNVLKFVEGGVSKNQSMRP